MHSVKRAFCYLFLGSLAFGACQFGGTSQEATEQQAPASEPTNPLKGSWELVSNDFIFPDTTIHVDTSQLYSIYTIGEKYFSFITTGPDRSQLLGAGYGRYSSQGNIFIEHVEYHTNPFIVGTSVIFDSRIEGDLWIHDGYLPVRKEDPYLMRFAQGKPTFRFIEVRRRVSP